MRRWETLVALLAVVLASAAALPTKSRLFFAFSAMLLIVFVGFSRLRATLTGRRAPVGFDAAERARRIRDERLRNGPRGDKKRPLP